MRTAGPGDEGELYTWRNNADAVATSTTGRSVTWDEHREWFARTLKDASTVIYIAEDDGVRVGMCRFDMRDEIAEVSINLSPAFRGRGLASLVLGLAIEAIRHRASPPAMLTATIRADHPASVAIFAKHGFQRDGELEGFQLYSRSL